MGNLNEQLVERANHLESLVVDGVEGILPFEEFQAELDAVAQQYTTGRFELITNDTKDVLTFCAGSWAVSQLFGSHDIRAAVTILAESSDGPIEVRLSPYENNPFLIRAAD